MRKGKRMKSSVNPYGMVNRSPSPLNIAMALFWTYETGRDWQSCALCWSKSSLGFKLFFCKQQQDQSSPKSPFSNPRLGIWGLYRRGRRAGVCSHTGFCWFSTTEHTWGLGRAICMQCHRQHWQNSSGQPANAHPPAPPSCWCSKSLFTRGAFSWEKNNKVG